MFYADLFFAANIQQYSSVVKCFGRKFLNKVNFFLESGAIAKITAAKGELAAEK